MKVKWKKDNRYFQIRFTKKAWKTYEIDDYFQESLWKPCSIYFITLLLF